MKIVVKLWTIFRDESDATITKSESLKFKARITGRTFNDVNTLLMIKDVEIAVH